MQNFCWGMPGEFSHIKTHIPGIYKGKPLYFDYIKRIFESGK